MLADTNVYSDFDTLAAFSGEPGQFWPRLRAYAQATFLAQGSCLLVQAQSESVRVLAQNSAQAAQRVAQSGVVSELPKMTDGSLHEWTDGLLVMSLPTGAGSRLWLVLLDAAGEQTDASFREIKMLAESYQSRRREQRTGDQVLGLSEVLDLGVALGESTTFSTAALRLCHRLAALLGDAGFTRLVRRRSTATPRHQSRRAGECLHSGGRGARTSDGRSGGSKQRGRPS